MTAKASIRYIRDVGQALVPYALIACMALGVKMIGTTSAMTSPDAVKVMREIADTLGPMQSRMRALEIRTDALETEFARLADD